MIDTDMFAAGLQHSRKFILDTLNIYSSYMEETRDSLVVLTWGKLPFPGSILIDMLSVLICLFIEPIKNTCTFFLT